MADTTTDTWLDLAERSADRRAPSFRRPRGDEAEYDGDRRAHRCWPAGPMTSRGSRPARSDPRWEEDDRTSSIRRAMRSIAEVDGRMVAVAGSYRDAPRRPEPLPAVGPRRPGLAAARARAALLRENFRRADERARALVDPRPNGRPEIRSLVGADRAGRRRAPARGRPRADPLVLPDAPPDARRPARRTAPRRPRAPAGPARPAPGDPGGRPRGVPRPLGAARPRRSRRSRRCSRGRSCDTALWVVAWDGDEVAGLGPGLDLAGRERADSASSAAGWSTSACADRGAVAAWPGR